MLTTNRGAASDFSVTIGTKVSSYEINVLETAVINDNKSILLEFEVAVSGDDYVAIAYEGTVKDISFDFYAFWF